MARLDERSDLSKFSESDGSSGGSVSFSLDTYELAKPFLIQVVKPYHLRAENIDQIASQLLSDLVHKHNWTRDRLERMKPCLVHFIKDVMAGRVEIEPQADGDADAVDGSGRRSGVRHVLKEALDNPTPGDLVAFVDFAVRFRRLSVWNARMAQLQRPGASVIASEDDWTSVDRHVLPRAVPIIILWPFAPIRLVYELDDTGPPIDRSTYGDPFAVAGSLHPRTFDRLLVGLAKEERYRIQVESRRKGFTRAPSRAVQHHLPLADLQLSDSKSVGSFAKVDTTRRSAPGRTKVSSYRIVLNDRLDDRERFVTVAHQLGHIFCGHLGKCRFQPTKHDVSGWPDRRSLGAKEMEIEAEAVSYLVSARAGLVAPSAGYLHPYAKAAEMEKVDVDLIVRAAARIERLARIHHGPIKVPPRCVS